MNTVTLFLHECGTRRLLFTFVFSSFQKKGAFFEDGVQMKAPEVPSFLPPSLSPSHCPFASVPAKKMTDSNIIFLGRGKLRLNPKRRPL